MNICRQILIVSLTLALAEVLTLNFQASVQAAVIEEATVKLVVSQSVSEDVKAASGSLEGESQRATDFRTEIEPVLRAACVKCHNQQTPSGGLRLDHRSGAAKGGASGRPILGGKKETNELLRRITSDDPLVRMPLGGVPLQGGTVQKFRDWIESGTPWPDDAPISTGEQMNEIKSSSVPAASLSLLDRLFTLVNWLTKDVRYFWHFVAAFVILQVVAILLEGTKAAARKNRPWTAGKWVWWTRLSAHFGVGPYLIAIAGLIGGLTIVNLRIANEDLRREQQVLSSRVKDLQKSISALTGGATAESIYGNPPRPFRMTHPRQIHGVYYRGNDERNEKLFNNGNYRTAVLRIGIENSKGERLEYGDKLPKEGFSLYFEAERAPFATEALFSDNVIQAVDLSSRPTKDSKPDGDLESARDVTLKPVPGAEGKRWRATYPIRATSISKDGKLQGTLYVRYHDAPSYGIVYDLEVTDGRIGSNSDVWMGNLAVLPSLAVPQRNKVPQEEWLDYRPIPELKRPNEVAPDLLGIPEHQQKQK